MRSTGIVRPVDRMGRVVIPKEIRRQLKIENDLDVDKVLELVKLLVKVKKDKMQEVVAE